MDIKPLKTAKNSHENHAVPLNDCGIARSADILAFHCSLDRHFDRDHNFSGECHPFYELVYVEEGTVGITAGVTPVLSIPSQFLIMLFMYFGRVGILTISLGFLIGNKAEDRIRYADTNLLIG
jgi:hypothetical protein